MIEVAIIDPTAQKVLGRAPTGDGPHEVVATTDGKLAVASNYGSGQTPGHTLSVIDIASRKEIHRVDLSPLLRPHGLFSMDGKVYFTAEGSKAIGRYDPATNRVDWCWHAYGRNEQRPQYDLHVEHRIWHDLDF